MRSLLLLIAATTTSTIAADEWQAPRPRIYASTSGEYALKVVPSSSGRALATLYTLDSQAQQRVLWTARLVNIPHVAHVSDSARVLTLNTHGRVGYEHSIVVYDDMGKPAADYRLEELLTAAELSKVTVTESSRWWLAPGRSAIATAPDGRTRTARVWGLVIERPIRDHLIIETSSGRQLVVDMATGELVDEKAR